MAAASPIAEFQKLLEATSKADAQRLAGQLVLDARHFGELKILAQKLGFTHSLIRKEWSPAQKVNVPELMDKLVAGSKSEDPKIKKKGASAFNVIKQLFVERKLVFAHFFEKQNEWHIFYFTGQDYTGGHFEFPHIHYASHLWNHDLVEIKASFDKRDYSFATEHLQIIPLS